MCSFKKEKYIPREVTQKSKNPNCLIYVYKCKPNQLQTVVQNVYLYHYAPSDIMCECVCALQITVFYALTYDLLLFIYLTVYLHVI